jgi:hypothetical protein
MCLPSLPQAARLMCSECERRKATRRCKSCRDNFCDTCFKDTHKKGRYPNL